MQLPPTTVDLVLSVVTVLLSVTFPEDGDALGGAYSAAELVHATRPHVCINEQKRVVRNVKQQVKYEAILIHLAR